MKKILITLAIILGSLYSSWNIVFAGWDLPTLNGFGLAWYENTSPENPTVWSKDKLKSDNNILFSMLGNIISTLIQYVGVVSVVSIILSWFMMLLSWGDEEKVNKTKKWIIYSLIWVFVSLSSFWIIKIMDNLNIKIESKQTENQSN